MSASVLHVANLRKTYRKSLAAKPVEALKGISFEIRAGTITGFLGANGAGKTTTIKCLLNLAFADSGEISYFGVPELTSDVKSRIGFLPERPYFYEYLTGAEFLRFYADLSPGLKRVEIRERIDKLLKRVGLDHARDRQLRSYSKGMLQRVGIAQALIHEPEFVILDEPMTGLDPDGRLEVTEIIRETARAGTAVFFSSHLLPDAEKICDRLVILKLGQLVYQGATEDLLNRVGSGYTVSWRNSGRIEQLQTANLAEAQGIIDDVRRRGCEVIEVKGQRLSLEEAFVQIGFDREAKA